MMAENGASEDAITQSLSMVDSDALEFLPKRKCALLRGAGLVSVACCILLATNVWHSFFHIQLLPLLCGLGIGQSLPLASDSPLVTFKSFIPKLVPDVLTPSKGSYVTENDVIS